VAQWSDLRQSLRLQRLILSLFATLLQIKEQKRFDATLLHQNVFEFIRLQYDGGKAMQAVE